MSHAFPYKFATNYLSYIAYNTSFIRNMGSHL